MRPQFRCALNPNACPSSGSVVVLDVDDPDEVPCPVCDRPLKVRARYDRLSGQHLAKIPEHRRPRGADHRTAAQVARAFKAAAVAEYKARQAVRRKSRKARAALAKAIDAVTALPPSQTRDRRLTVLHRRVAYVAKLEAPRPPRAVGRQLAALEDASALDVSTVDPGWDGRAETGAWVEHLERVLSKAALRRLRRTAPHRQIKAGLAELLRMLRARRWSDFDARGFVGDESWLAFVRAFPGLEGLRLPDEAHEAAADVEALPF